MLNPKCENHSWPRQEVKTKEHPCNIERRSGNVGVLESDTQKGVIGPPTLAPQCHHSFQLYPSFCPFNSQIICIHILRCPHVFLQAAILLRLAFCYLEPQWFNRQNVKVLENLVFMTSSSFLLLENAYTKCCSIWRNKIPPIMFLLSDICMAFHSPQAFLQPH